LSEKKFKKYRFQLLKFFLYHMIIPTLAAVFITISSAWKLKFFGGYCFDLCTCVCFFETVFWWSWSWNSGLDYKTA